jgi:hypothetical protein
LLSVASCRAGQQALCVSIHSLLSIDMVSCASSYRTVLYLTLTRTAVAAAAVAGWLAGGSADAEFTRLSDYDFSAPDVFVEIFDVEKDPGQLVNLVNETTAEDMAFYKQMVREQFACAGKSCK